MIRSNRFLIKEWCGYFKNSFVYPVAVFLIKFDLFLYALSKENCAKTSLTNYEANEKKTPTKHVTCSSSICFVVDFRVSHSGNSSLSLSLSVSSTIFLIRFKCFFKVFYPAIFVFHCIVLLVHLTSLCFNWIRIR